MGWADDFFAVAQWFPKLAKLEPNGTWRHFPYQALAEFYADFGDYDVTIHVPAAFEIAAPGNSGQNNEGSGHRAVHYQLRGAHDFVWFAWPGFVRTQRVLGNVALDAFAPKGHEHNVQLELDDVSWGLTRFQRLLGSYAYSKLVIVHPPDIARAAGGMEYPGLIVTGGAWYASYLGSRALSAVALHELAHQWFYGLVATDEVTYPVLDEGLSSWEELSALSDRYGAGSAISLMGTGVSALAVAEQMGTAGYEPGPLSRPATSFPSFRKLTHTIYARTALMLQTIANVYGLASVNRALHDYSVRQRCSHPAPDALVASVAKEVGSAAAHNLKVALESDGWIEFKPLELKNTPLANGQWRILARVRCEGTLAFPVEVKVSLANDSSLERTCCDSLGICELQFESNSPAVELLIDPHRKIVVELQQTDNAIHLGPALKPYSLSERLIYLAQLLQFLLLS